MYSLGELLSAVGLEEKEIPIFIYLHNFGGQTAGIIASRLNLNRSSLYLLLEKMVKSGFLEQSNHQGITIFSAVNPALLVKKTRRQYGHNLIQLANLEKLLATQSSHHSQYHHNNSKATYFQGKSVLIQMMDQIIAERPELLRAYISPTFQNFILTNTRNYHLERVKYNIKAKALFPFKKVQSSSCTNKADLRESKFLPDQFNLGVDCLIFKNKVALLSLEEEFATVIESPAISGAKAKLFDYAWNSAQSI